MNLKKRLEKLETQFNPGTIEIIIVGARFYRDASQQKEEISIEDVKKLAGKYQTVKISGVLDYEGAALLESLDCDNLEFNIAKYYLNVKFSDWPDA